MSENINNAMLGVYGCDIEKIIKAALSFMQCSGSHLDANTAKYSKIETTPDGELYLTYTNASKSRRDVRRTIFKNAERTDFNSKVRVWLAGAIKGMAKLEGCGCNYRKQAIAASKEWSRTNNEKTMRFEFTFAQAYAVYDILMDRKTKADRYGESAKAILSAGPNDPVLTELETYRQNEIAKAQADKDAAFKLAERERETVTSAAWNKYWNDETRIKEDYKTRIENINMEVNAALAELRKIEKSVLALAEPANAEPSGSQPAVAA